MTDLATRYAFVMQQMAAESYLDNLHSLEDDGLKRQLTLGANRSEPKPGEGSATRMTKSQAKEFLDHYDIIDQLPNTESGFSATLLRNKSTHEYTLSFRSTEYRYEKDGGNFRQDAQGADWDIFVAGFAFAQIRDMENYFAHLQQGERLNPTTRQWEPGDRLAEFKAQFGGKMPARDALNVTGYSLGAHLATVFTENHTDEVKRTYTFNAAGRGHFDSQKHPGLHVRDIQEKFWEVVSDPAGHTLPFVPSNALTVGGDQSLSALYQAALARQKSHLQSPTEDIYQDPRYQWAKEWTKATYGITNPPSPGRESLSPEVDAKIIQSYGHATHGDVEHVANAGVHASQPKAFFIEDQPDIEGLTTGHLPTGPLNPLLNQLGGDYGNTHSLALLADSLALMKTLEPLGDLNSAQLGALFAAASSERAQTWAINAQDRRAAESNSLEKVLDSMRKLLGVKARDQRGEYTIANGDEGWDTIPDGKARGFGNINNREIFHAHLQDLQKAIDAHPGLKLEPLVNPDQFESNGEPKKTVTPYSAARMAANANDNAEAGLAWRYTLKEQIPFVVTGDASIYKAHNQGGELNLQDHTSGQDISSQSIDARASQLERMIRLNVLNLTDIQEQAPIPKFPGLAAHARQVELFLAESGRPAAAIETIMQQIEARMTLQQRSGYDIPAYIYEKVELSPDNSRS